MLGLNNTPPGTTAARGEFDPAAGRNVEHEQLVALAQERQTAYQRLNSWYIDGSDAVRPHLTYHQAVRLGITAGKGGRASGAEPSAPQPAAPTDHG